MDILTQVNGHYQNWKDDISTRLTRKNGWNDITDAYWGKLPDAWPYLSKVNDPRIRTSLIEKNARLLNSKLRGRLVPREGGDVVKANINNAVLDFQWDQAQHGGSMLSKFAQMDMDTRLYGSKFALVSWKYETEKKKDGKKGEVEVKFNGNEFDPLDIRDCGIDPSAHNIKDAKWFQVRKWVFVEDLDIQDSLTGKAMYPGLSKLKGLMAEGVSQPRDNETTSRVLQLKGLTDRMGRDTAFPMLELVTEYRKDKWITFAPQYNLIMREIDNPYEHGKIPVVQLCYYKIQDDPIGESEVEPVLPLWRGIVSCLCGYLDEMNIKMRPPLKIIEGKTRLETIVYGPEAQWIVTSQDAVEEMQSQNQILNYFQTTYTSLISAFNSAMGDLSQGISSIDPMGGAKTATEVRATAKQQNTRDQKNQTDLAEAITDTMMMWQSNNKQFLFANDNAQEYILNIVGPEAFSYFKQAGLHEMQVTDEVMQMISDVIMQNEGNLSDMDMKEMMTAGETPLNPVFTNPNEKNPAKLQYKPKMEINDLGDMATLSIIPEDLDGTFDYIPDVKSMSMGAGEEMINARTKFVELILNPTVLQLLQAQGEQLDIKAILTSSYDDMGGKDGQRFFRPNTSQGPGGSLQQPGVPEAPTSLSPDQSIQQMAGSAQLSQPGGVPAGVPPVQSQGGGIPRANGFPGVSV